jgi:hypothetical protein
VRSPSGAARTGLSILPGLVPAAKVAALSTAYDRAIASGTPPDLRTSSSGSDARLAGLVGRDAAFDELFVLPPILEGCALVIGPSFKLSSFGARTVLPGAKSQALHVDVRRDDDAWPLVGFIVMIDDFRVDNGATRFVPGSHEWETPIAGHEHAVIACGAAGSLIAYHGSVWHGFSANRSVLPRRSIQGAYIPRSGKAAVDWAARLESSTLARLSPEVRRVLTLD